jgi:predicted transcriptional regulator
MNIQAEKLELLQLILNTDNPSVLNAIKRIFQKSADTDFWNALSEEQKEEIYQGLAEIENGEVVSYNEFIEKHW